MPRPLQIANRQHRRSIRLRGYDYSSTGIYFITLCAHQREMIFLDDRIQTIVKTAWNRIPKIFSHVHLDEWILMPNHLHGILVFQSGARHLQSGSIEQPMAEGSVRSGIQLPVVNASPLPGGPLIFGSLGAIIGNFKSITARRINGYRKTPGAPIWQRNYFEHIIRSDASLERHRKYIRDNPQNWIYDEDNPERTAAELPDN